MSEACRWQNTEDFGVTLVTDGNSPATSMTTMAKAKMAELVPMGLTYGVHASAAASQREGTPYWIIGRKIFREQGSV